MSISSYSQQTRRAKIDTLLRELPSLKEDENAARVYYLLGGRYMDIHLDSAAFYSKKSYLLSKTIGFEEGLIWSQKNLAATFLHKGQLDSSIILYNEAYKSSMDSKDTSTALYILNELTITIRRSGDYDSLNKRLNEAYRLAGNYGEDGSFFAALFDQTKAGAFSDKKKHDSAQVYWNSALEAMSSYNFKGYMAIINNNMANDYFSQSEYEVALEGFSEALKLATAIDYRPVELDAEIGIAKVYATIDNAKLAFERLKKVHEEEKAYNQPFRLAKVELEIIKTLNKRELYNESMKYALQGYKRADSIKSKDLRGDAFAFYIANFHYRNDDSDSAMLFLDIADSLAEVHQMQHQLIQNQILRAYCFIELDELGEATSLIDQLAKEELSLNQELKFFRLNYELNKIKQDYEKALEFHDLELKLSDSLMSIEKRGALIVMSSEIETHQKQMEIDLKASEIQYLNSQVKLEESRFIFAVSSLVLIGLGLFLTLLLIKRKAHFKERLIKKEKESLKHELTLKNKQLTTSTLEKAKKNQLLESLLQETNAIQSISEEDNRKLTNLVKQGLNAEKSIESFMLQFEELHPYFFEELRKAHPKLTPRDLQLSALLKLNFNTKDIAAFLSIEVGSATTARYRLRQKLNLSNEQNLTNYLQGLR